MQATSLIILIFIYRAHGLCDFPCSLRNRTWTWVISGFYLDAIITEAEPSRFTVSLDGNVLGYEDCYARYGPFIIFRSPGPPPSYSCNYFLHFDENFWTVRWGPYVTIPENGTLDFCETCSSIDGTDPGNFQAWVAKENLELNCNIPKNCPSSTGDNQCSGREKRVPDDGYCCTDQKESYASNMKYKYGRKFPSYGGSYTSKGEILPPWAYKIDQL